MNLVHRRTAVHGTFFLLPFILLNFVVALRIEPVYSFLGTIGVLTPKPWLITFLLLLFPVSVFVTIRPMLHKDENGHYRFYLLNIIWGILIFITTVLLWGGLGQDIIACDILHIPNCD